MKRALNILLAFAVLAMFVVSPVAAATSQGLEWGFATGDRFDFTMTDSESGLNEEMYMNITAMPNLAIPDPLSDWGDIPQPDIDMWWANGTDLGLWKLTFIALLVTGAKIAVPVGNFTHLWSLASSALTGESQIDEANVWGIRWSEDINATHEFAVRATFSKVDGFLANYAIETVQTSNNQVVESFNVDRVNLPSAGLDLSNITQLIQDNIVLVGAGVIVLILLVVICKKK